MTDTNTDHGGAVEAERYIDGRLDLTHAPSLGTFIGKTLASFVSRNKMPEISGDNRKRIPEHERRRYDPACVRLAEEILTALHPAPQTDTDAREKVVEGPMGCCGYIFAEGHNGTCTFYGMDHVDGRRLSRVFNQGADLRDDQDRRINEALKAILAALKTGGA